MLLLQKIVGRTIRRNILILKAMGETEWKQHERRRTEWFLACFGGTIYFRKKKLTHFACRTDEMGEFLSAPISPVIQAKWVNKFCPKLGEYMWLSTRWDWGGTQEDSSISPVIQAKCISSVRSSLFSCPVLLLFSYLVLFSFSVAILLLFYAKISFISMAP